MNGVPSNHSGPACATAVDSLEGEKLTSTNVLGCVYHSLQCFVRAVHNDTASQNALDGASIENPENGGPYVELQPPEVKAELSH